MMVRVGRWMSQEEYNKMVEQGRVQESYSGTTYVTYPMYQGAPPGSVYVEFDVPLDAIKLTQPGWAKILGPNTLEGRLATRKGLPVPQMPEASSIVLVRRK